MKKSLIDIVVETLGLSEEDLAEVRQSAAPSRNLTAELLVEKKIITEEQLLKVVSDYYGLPFWPELPFEKITGDYTEHVPIHFLKKHLMVPLGNSRPVLQSDTATTGVPDEQADTITTIALNDPSALWALDDLARVIGANRYQAVVSTKSAIISAINMSYVIRESSTEQLVQDMEDNHADDIATGTYTADLLDDTSDAPIVKLVNNMISQSVKARASDIHIEPFQNGLKVRHRVDGILYDLITLNRTIQPPLISRVKVMAGMNIAEKRLPQDGRIDIKIGEQELDVRVSTIPTSFGERLVLRLLHKSGSLIQLSGLGLTTHNLKLLEELSRRNNGIILVTGPTGSGKTTTLYAVLSSINHPDVNIITIEDPVEYQIKGINQIQVNPKIDLTFARGLRSIVRQDPDVILIGEIRDLETAEIAVQSALTGHLVFSTLHTNDSASAITRLVDIGVEPFLISSSVIAVLAQRLVRVLCPACKQPYRPEDQVLESIGITREALGENVLYRVVGCEKCMHTGYRGRTGIFEIMSLNPVLKALILSSFDSNQIKEEALRQEMITLRDDGIQKVLQGITTFEEVLRVAQK